MQLNRLNVEQIDIWLDNLNIEGGFVLLDKALDWTSFDVVAKLRNLTKIKKVGHAGTLDPLATGLLILCFGKFTKKIQEFQDLKKGYRSVFKLGATTPTYDSEMPEENHKSIENLTLNEIKSAIDSFKGDIQQLPPIYSAKKVKGKRLYKLARENREIEVNPSSVYIYEYNIVNYNAPFLEVDIICSKGTYIRSLAHDLGNKLDCGAYIKELRRTSIGDFYVNHALTVVEFENLFKQRNSRVIESL
jgi:tRNA pseudouridine55 synthase